MLDNVLLTNFRNYCTFASLRLVINLCIMPFQVSSCLLLGLPYLYRPKPKLLHETTFSVYWQGHFGAL